ncbi:Peptidase family S41 [Lachnospiraceae bacterium KH1T2]|nr:Peptidase family S41 [Lachnospiraceae bacterium KH1T2]
MKRKMTSNILAAIMAVSMVSTGCASNSAPTAEAPVENEAKEETTQSTEAAEATETVASVETATSETSNESGEMTIDQWLESELERLENGGKLDPAFTVGQITKKEVPIYYNSVSNNDTIELAFFDEDGAVPYLCAEDIPTVMGKAYQTQYLDNNFKLTFLGEGSVATLTRENGFWMKFDCDKDTITFIDLDGFLMGSTMDSWGDVVNAQGLKNEKARDLFQSTGNSSERYGDAVVLKLEDYGIDLIKDGDHYYMPLATLNDFVLAHNYIPTVYNGDSVILYNYGNLKDDDTGELKELGKLYFEGKPGKISKSMAKFSYNELCLMLDYHYGLKEVHGIDSFDELFLQTGTKAALLSDDPEIADKALCDFIFKHLDDGHSSFGLQSYYSGEDKGIDGTIGSSLNLFVEEVKRFMIARSKYYPDGVPGYEEVGNTAYITFDGFKSIPDDADYYNNPPTEGDPEDPVGLLIYSYGQITRDGSPIKNVVLDLSCNGGGDSNTAGFVLGTFMGTGTYSIKNAITGATITDYVNVDLNLDHEFDEKDSLQGYNLYCLESGYSFSCGNLVPNVFKNTHKVTLLGQTSGGGSCMVLPAATASGTTFQISGPLRMSFTKNGSFYDIDQGAEPDFYIDDPDNFYNRKALTDYINKLF